MSKPKGTGPNAFWHLKLTYELGCLLYRQNNFTSASKIFSELSKNAAAYNESYYKIFGEAFIERCKLRLGEINK
jgi:hypothetical protein